MKFLEKVFTILALIGVSMKLLHIYSGGMELIAIALLCLSALYLLFGFFLFNNIRLRDCFKRECYKGINAVKIIGSVVSSVVLSISIAAILFRLLYWDANVKMLLAAIGINIIFTFIIILVVAFRSAIFYRNILIRSAILLIIMGTLAISPTNYLEKEKRKVITMECHKETRLLENRQ